MHKILSVLFLLLIVPAYLQAQIKPEEGSKLNYRIIGFSFPLMHGVNKYGIEIASGNYNNEDDFQKHIITNVVNKKNRVIAEVPDFGAQYTWQVVYTDNHANIKKSKLYHFSTLIVPDVDTDSTRLRVTIPAVKDKDDYVFHDGNRVLYDMKGRPVWFLPNVEGPITRTLKARDFKRSYWGTITFMMNEHLYEISYNGDLLWKEPQKDSFRSKRIPNRNIRNAKVNNLHHHDFTHLPDGHYMTLGMENIPWELPESMDTFNIPRGLKLRVVKDTNGKTIQKIFSGRLIEFDKDHNEVWSWSSAEYFKQSDLYYRRRPNGLFKVGNTHENAFYFDEKAKTIYVSFRNINRIIKFQYPSGRVLSTYGALYETGNLELNNEMFCGQHCCRKSMDGYIYMYNNNTCNRLCGQLPTILMIADAHTKDGKLQKIWEYKCTVEDKTEQEILKLNLETGGNVFELPDRSIFCCMAGNYGKVFIVNRDKQILWSAVPEVWNKTEKKWDNIFTYRASIITRKELESLIWGEPLKK